MILNERVASPTKAVQGAGRGVEPGEPPRQGAAQRLHRAGQDRAAARGGRALLPGDLAQPWLRPIGDWSRSRPASVQPRVERRACCRRSWPTRSRASLEAERLDAQGRAPPELDAAEGQRAGLAGPRRAAGRDPGPGIEIQAESGRRMAKARDGESISAAVAMMSFTTPPPKGKGAKPRSA